jgi:prolyl oligopeptidase
MKNRFINSDVHIFIYNMMMVVFFACNENMISRISSGSTTVQYPKTRRDGSISDNYHGTVVPDPYRWLEDDQAEATKAWVKAQNEVTFDYLDRIPYRRQFRDRLSKLWNYERYLPPMIEGGKYYYFKNDGLQNQQVLYVQDTPESEASVLLDPNTFFGKGSVALGSVSFNKTGGKMAFTISEGGSDWMTALVMDVTTGEVLRDTIRWIKFSSLSWWKDGFFYGRYPAPVAGEELTGIIQYYKIYYHRLGTDQSEDQLIYEDPANPDNYFYCNTTEDEHFLVLSEMPFAVGNKLAFRDLRQSNSRWIQVVDNIEKDYFLIGNNGDNIFVLTNDGAPRYRIISIPVDNPAASHWQEILPEGKDVIQEAFLMGGKLVVSFLHNASSAISLYTLEGQLEKTIELPAIGTVNSFSGNMRESTIYFTFSSFTYPATVFQLDLGTGITTPFRSPKVDFDPTGYETRQVWYVSKDSILVPMFVVHKKGMKLDGANPCFLFGYGAFNFSMTPQFNAGNMLLLENGGIFALANIRGGGEFGELWHKAGVLSNKQHMIDDFIAAAEFLIREKYTSPGKLGISGISNGGMLAGACMTQRPDLYRVCIPRVGVMDMLRYHLFTVGMAWAEEYGLSSDPTAFKSLIRYSPLHNIRSVAYPATLVLTGDHDDRVVPAHSFKFIAELQYRQKGDLPVLIRIDTGSGHGAGKSTATQVEEYVDMFAFFYHHVGR